MPAQTLINMAIQKAVRVVAQISDFAEMPYELARPILQHVSNPQQLRDIEVNCPHLAEQSEELWRRFIARDIPDWKEKIVEPKNPSSWHKVYRYLQRKEEQKAADDEEALRKAMQGEVMKKTQTQTLHVKKALPHPRAEDEPTKFIDGVARKDLTGWGEPKQPTLRNAKNGKDIMSAIRRQTAFASNQKSHAASLRPPTQAQQLASAKRQITEAPQSMVREISKAQNHLTIAPRELLPHEKEQLAEIRRNQVYSRKIIGPRAPGRLSDLQFANQHRHIVDAARAKALAENEAKLRAITEQQKKAASSTPTKPKKEFETSPVVVEPAKRNVSPQAKSKKRTAAEMTSDPLPPAPRHYHGADRNKIVVPNQLSDQEKAEWAAEQYAEARKAIRIRDEELKKTRITDEQLAEHMQAQAQQAARRPRAPPQPAPQQSASQQAAPKRPAANIFMAPRKKRRV